MTTVQTPPLASFTELRRLAQTSSIAHACIELRAQEIACHGWDIVPERALARSIKGYQCAIADCAERRSQAVRFFRHPDGNYSSFISWLHTAMREVLTTDALTIYPHPPQVPGHGLLDGNVATLDLIDGAVIEPVLNGAGRLAGYAQYFGYVPRRSQMEMIAQPLSGAPEQLYGRTQVRYLPFGLRHGMAFGVSPLEDAIVRSEDGSIDVKATEAKVPGKFGLPPSAIGITEWYADQVDRDGWLRDRLSWLAAFFDDLLAGSGLRWQWEGLA